jgi:hypothetical protein
VIPDAFFGTTEVVPFQNQASTTGCWIRDAMPATNQNDDGTRQLLVWGGWIVGTGVVAAILLETMLGGISPTGASTNTGWFAFIVALGCIPFGLMLLTLGVAKWLRNRRLAKTGIRGQGSGFSGR